jgi:hypothetical protein
LCQLNCPDLFFFFFGVLFFVTIITQLTGGGPARGASTGRGGTGGGKLDGCIMHQVHTSRTKFSIQTNNAFIQLLSFSTSVQLVGTINLVGNNGINPYTSSYECVVWKPYM